MVCMLVCFLFPFYFCEILYPKFMTFIHHDMQTRGVKIQSDEVVKSHLKFVKETQLPEWHWQIKKNVFINYFFYARSSVVVFGNLYTSMCYQHVFKSFFLLKIDKKAMKTSGMVARVINEVEIHCQLKHPSVLEVHALYISC